MCSSDLRKHPGFPYSNLWDVSVGHVEPNETIKECIIREMKEEMNIDLRMDLMRS